MEKGRIWSEMQSHCILLWLIDELPPPPPQSRLSSKTVQFSEIPTKSAMAIQKFYDLELILRLVVIWYISRPKGRFYMKHHFLMF